MFELKFVHIMQILLLWKNNFDEKNLPQQLHV